MSDSDDVTFEPSIVDVAMVRLFEDRPRSRCQRLWDVVRRRKPYDSGWLPLNETGGVEITAEPDGVFHLPPQEDE